MRVALLAFLIACGAAPSPKPEAAGPKPADAAHVVAAPTPPHHLADPDLNPPHVRLVDVDWRTVSVPDDAAALALWQKIAPTGDDWERKLDEIPGDAPAAHALALALLHGGNFACPAPVVHTHNCQPVPPDMPAPASTAGLDDPCLRRLLALWALDQVEVDDIAALKPELRAIAALPPPESQLVVAAIGAVPEAQQDERLAMLDLAWHAGQTDLVAGEIGRLDVPHVVQAVKQLHVPAALEMLSADGNRAVYLAAVVDDKMPTAGRTSAITDLAALPDFGADVRAAMVTAAGSPDCTVAARAARVLDDHGDHRFLPRRPRGATTAAQLARSLCVLASYEQAQPTGEASLWPTYLSAHGVERVAVAYDPLSDSDPDGDGDVHTSRTFDVEPRRDAVLPEIDDLVRAMSSCTVAATSLACKSPSRQFRFAFTRDGGELVVRQLEVAELPPCQDR